MAASEDFSEIPLSCLEVDDSLEGRLQAHGLSRRNVKSMIHSIFTDKNVQKLLEASEERLKLDIPLAVVTRSKKWQCNEILDTSIDCDISELNCHSATGKLTETSGVSDKNTKACSVWTWTEAEA